MPFQPWIQRMSKETSHRLDWVDDLRTFLVTLVVNMHACVTYSHVGGWYIKENPKPDQGTQVLFAVWQAHLQSFFMGLLFLVAGIFVVGSLQRRGFREFIRERLFRLGLPSLLYMLVLQPLVVRGLLRDYYGISATWPQWYLHYIASARVLSGSGPLWFALALLGFSLVYAFACKMRPGLLAQSQGSTPPGPGLILAWILVVAVCSYLVRGAHPVGSSVFNFQLCYFPQYIAAFLAGTIAGRNGWLESRVNSPSLRWIGWSAIIGGPLLLAVMIWVGGLPQEGIPNPYEGRWTPHSFFLASWEQLTGVALSLGLMHFLATRRQMPGRVAQWLSRRTFGVYVLHPPILVGLTLLFRPIPLGPGGHMLLLTLSGSAASYAAAGLALRIPGLRRILR